ncbi:MotA/TolQ/ExbB proton channel family protein [Halanaerobium sp. Z-7514]|uniref:MotA/TolQ/ExbB proton channel family protein n=1 Tax=Halanaerobium polyolivorans TaxID=2886943 RepID=A0AAW4WTG3_9FIRM|nr:MotA/TolQ/ExbB proton channel family protein [Halanaerobium polyolivorans]MCC3143810.1 MotA/TolQ/ExbB proton channel family protein [Halanaerobium polyolivorans]
MIGEFINKAGIIAYPLLLSAFLVIFMVFERSIIYLLKYRSIKKEKYLSAIKEFYHNQADEDNLIVKNKGITAQIYNAVLSKKPVNKEQFQLFMDAEEVDKLPELERGLGLLNFLAQASPTLGLLGTVSGMINTFQVLGIGGSPEQMAVGISEALFTTAAGLVISLPALAFYHYFYSKIDKLVNQMDNLRLETKNLLYNGFKKEID